MQRNRLLLLFSLIPVLCLIGTAMANAPDSAHNSGFSIQRVLPGTTTEKGATPQQHTAARAAVSRPDVSPVKSDVQNQKNNVIGRSAVPSRIIRTNVPTKTDGSKSGSVSRVAIPQSGATTRSVIQARTPLITMSGGMMSGGVAQHKSQQTDKNLAQQVSQTIAEMDDILQMTEFCKTQYSQCMDNFCNILDDSYGRCTCSPNLKNYTKTENALKQATSQLQDVAQKIRFIGLSADEISSLLSQTEAEQKMQNLRDNSDIQTDLARIKKMIIQVKDTSVSATGGETLDLSELLDFSSNGGGVDLSSLFTLHSNSSSISNQRGEQLYKTATARCKTTVLNECTKQGVDAALVTNSYDLSIDNRCMQYERELTNQNESMKRTVRNATTFLQKARLMVKQQKNEYDLRGCVNALDACMQDEMVCGTDYANCLDPSGKYIVAGEIVIGSKPGMPGGEITSTTTNVADGLYSTWNYTGANAWSNGTVSKYVQAYLGQTKFPIKTPVTMANFLQNKIGWAEKGKIYGLCMPVLEKCQDLTYKRISNTGKDKIYDTSNQVLRNYLERTSIQIKKEQDRILSDYAAVCMSDVISCLTQNDFSNLSHYQSGTLTEPSDAALNACRAIIETCQSVTTGSTGLSDDIKAWIKAVFNKEITTVSIGGTNESNTPESDDDESENE